MPLQTTQGSRAFESRARSYLIMERIDGPALSRWISEQTGGVLPVPTAQRLFAQLCSALAHAHRAGFVHCDVKPENVCVVSASRRS